MIWRDLVWEYVCRLADPEEYFNIQELSKYYDEMAERKPGNAFVSQNVRQQLQILRDRGFVQFVAPGSYKRLR